MTSNCEKLYEVLKTNFLLDYPYQKNLFHTRDDFSEYEGNYYYNAFHEKTWGNLIENDFSLIKETFNKVKTFGFFTVEGFVYYFPAFVLYFSKNKDTELMQPFCFRLRPGDTEDSMNRLGNFFTCLTEENIFAVKKSLTILNDIWSEWGEKDNEAGAALSEYWGYI